MIPFVKCPWCHWEVVDRADLLGHEPITYFVFRRPIGFVCDKMLNRFERKQKEKYGWFTAKDIAEIVGITEEEAKHHLEVMVKAKMIKKVSA